MVALIACPEALWTSAKTAVIKKRTENWVCFINGSAD
jgi:hypothetical protein